MQALESYVEQKNRIRVMFGGDAIDLHKADDRRFLAECIENELSPENLTCDGELSRTQVTRKLSVLTRCQEELAALER